MAVFVVQKKKKKIKIVKNPVLKKERTEGHENDPGEYVFYGARNGQRVHLPEKSNKTIHVEKAYRAQSLDEPFDWRNSYEAVLTRIGYVLIGGDVLRGIETGLNEYPIRWYKSLEDAKKDYRICGAEKAVEEQPDEKKKEFLRTMASLQKAKEIIVLPKCEPERNNHEENEGD